MLIKEKLIELIKKTFLYKSLKKRFYQTHPDSYRNAIMDNEQTAYFMSKLLINDKPCLVSRLGSNELKTLEYAHKKIPFTQHTKHVMINNAGFFPSDDVNLNKFANLYFESIKEVDLLGIWFNPFEDFIANDICPNAKLTVLRNLEPYFSDNPWSLHLKGKKVLVIHPFTQSIENQYQKRELLFKNPNVLPEFTLITYPAIQSLGGNDEYESWFHALDTMKENISKIDFDIAIIGAGAYGLPLASHVKDIGKKAIHLGGATQMLFGVYGQRWGIHPDFQEIINDHWAKPTPNEKPKNATKVENACYW